MTLTYIRFNIMQTISFDPTYLQYKLSWSRPHFRLPWPIQPLEVCPSFE